MRLSHGMAALALAAICTTHAMAQSQPARDDAAILVLTGLSPVSGLGNTAEGKAALAANYERTGAIQNGTAGQPTLLPHALQQQLALRDAFITFDDAADLADGLGSKLGATYQAAAHYSDPKHWTNVTPGVATLIGTTARLTGRHANLAKFFFANGTVDGKTPVAPELAAILPGAQGVTDIFGIAYGHPGGSPGNDPYGNSRPFQTLKQVAAISGADYFGRPDDNAAAQGFVALIRSPSYPSGHTTYAYTEAMLLAVMVPERYTQMVTRAAEYGNDRIVLGAHYTMDVLGGRTLALYDLAGLLANADYQTTLQAARADLRNALQACGGSVPACATQDDSRFAKPEANRAFYETTQTYGLPAVHADTAAKVEDVATVAPEAGYLLTSAFPALGLAEAQKILTETEGPGGGFLDNGSRFGLYSRLDLYAAGEKAAASLKTP